MLRSTLGRRCTSRSWTPIRPPHAKPTTRASRTGRRTTTTIGGRNPRNTYGISTVLWDDRRGPRPVGDQAVQQRNAPGGPPGVGGIPAPASVAGAPSQRRGAQQGRSPAGAGAGRGDPCPALGGAVADLSEVSLDRKSTRLNSSHV